MAIEHENSRDRSTHLTHLDQDTLAQRVVDICGIRTHAGPSQLRRGGVLLNYLALREMRQARLLSQQGLADDCWRRNIPLSLTTIKRAELGRPVSFRIAREFARCFEVPVTRVLHVEVAMHLAIGPGDHLA